MGSHQEDQITESDVLIVGAGFSGIYGLHKLRQLGYKVKVFEAGTEIGGVWNWNRYPGARVDSEWPYYQLSIPEVWKDFYFTERFPDHSEIRRYFAHADKVLNLSKDIVFRARVNSAEWDEKTSKWTVRTEAGHVGRARFLLLFTGLLHRPYMPDFSGLGDFQGGLHHSAMWPKGGLDVTGKKVAVIGGGATSVQIVQELAKQAKELTVFLRRPSLCLPMENRKVSHVEQNMWKPSYQMILKSGKKTAGGFLYTPAEKGIFDMTDDERNEYYEIMWRAGGFSFAGGNFPEIYIDRNANRLSYDFWAKKVRARIQNDRKRDLMAPLEPLYPILTNRCPLEQDYYECLDQDNVEIVSLKETPLKTFTKTGIVTADGKTREFDYVALATGFDSFTGSVTTMGLKNKQGIDIKDIWKDGVRTYLGMLMHGFPNCFLSYSPQAPTALSNGPTIIESQVDFIIDAIVKMDKEGMGTIEPTAEAEEEWRQKIVQSGNMTLFAETDSWWVGSNIPGKKREVMTYLGGIGQYEPECRATLQDWRGFEMRSSNKTQKKDEGNWCRLL